MDAGRIPSSPAMGEQGVARGTTVRRRVRVRRANAVVVRIFGWGGVPRATARAVAGNGSGGEQ